MSIRVEISAKKLENFEKNKKIWVSFFYDKKPWFIAFSTKIL